MPAQPLEYLPDGSDVFVDANVFVYGLTGTSTQCLRLLERCSKQQVRGVCLFEILNEATHQFMLAEAVRKEFIRREGDWKALAKKPDLVSRLHDYWTNTERVLNLNLLFVPTNDVIVRRAHPVRQAEGLLTNDSMIVAFMQYYGVGNLATGDGAFERVAGITVFRPDDLPKSSSG